MSSPQTQSSYVFGDYRLSPEQRQLLGPDGQNIDVRGKAFDLLVFLIHNKGRLVGKDELLHALWPDTIVEENNLNQSLSALRQALGDDARAPAYIATIKGRGYQFICDVRPESTPATDGSAETSTSTGHTRYLPVLIAAAGIIVALFVWFKDKPDDLGTGTPVIERFAEATLSIATDYAGSQSKPTLSPDGRMMAYVGNSDGIPQVWVKNLERGDRVQITHSTFPASSPSWSPNSDQVLFDRTSPNGVSIYSVGILGTPEATMVVDYGRSPKYSKGVNAFVYSIGRRIWIARNDGRDRQEIRGIPTSQGFAEREPALSPDGKLVAFIHADEGPLGNLWLIPSEGGEARQLTTLESGKGIAGAPEWSADGRFIVYSVDATTTGGQLWRFDLDNGETAALTKGAGGAREPSLSIDGSRLAYTATRTVWLLTRIDPETGERSTIHSSREPVLLPIVSPDRQRIVFFTRNPTGMQIFVIDNDGDNLRQLTFDEPGENALPTWSADGNSIFYYRGPSLYRLNLADGSDAEVFADFHWSSRNWLAASGERISYHNIDRPTGMQKTLVRTLGESTEIELAMPIEAAQWSIDGRELVGWFRQTGELLICDPDAGKCRTIENGGETVRGARPMWSLDGQQVYFLVRTDKDECCVLRRINVDGSHDTRIAYLPGLDFSNSYYGLDANGDVFYNHLDRSTDEIWLAVLDPDQPP